MITSPTTEPMQYSPKDLLIFFNIDRAFQPVLNSQEETVYLYTLLNAVEMMETGYTTVADSMYQLNGSVKGIIDSGMRGKMCETTVDFHEASKAPGLISRAIDFYDQYNGAGDGRIDIDFCIHGTYSCSEELMTGIAKAAEERQADIQIHVSESRQEQADVMEQYGTTPTKLLEKLGILSNRLIAAHYVQADDEDIELAAKRGMRVVHNIASNLKLASGVAPVSKLRSHHIPVGLGTDSSVTNNRLDAFDTMKLTALVHKGYWDDATMLPAKTILEMSTIEGARALGMEKEIGSIEVGKYADLIIVRMAGKANYIPLLFSDMDHTISNLVYSGNGSDVETVIINGTVVMENGRFSLFDKEDLLERAQKNGIESVRRAHLLQ